jgi:hypothetical protein
MKVGITMKSITLTTTNPQSSESSLTTVHLTSEDSFTGLRAHVDGYTDTGDVSDEELIARVQSEGITVDMREAEIRIHSTWKRARPVLRGPRPSRPIRVGVDVHDRLAEAGE